MIKRLLNSTLLRSSGIYTVSAMINSAIPFLMMPVLTRYLTPTDYGIVAMFTVLLGIVGPFVGFNIQGAVSVRYFDKNETDMPKYVGNCMFLLLIGTAAVSLLMWLFAKPISTLTAFPGEWLWAVVLVSSGQFVVLVVMTLWQVENRPVRYGIFQNLQTLLNISLTVVLVVFLGRNWQGRIEAQIVAVLVFALVGLALLYRNGWSKFSYERTYLNHALKFGVPLIPHALGGMLIAQTDRVFITNMVGVADTGIYMVGFQVAAVIELLASSFNRAYVPWLYKHLAEDDFAMKKRIVKLTYLYFAGIALFASLLSILAPWFLSFFVGEKFHNAYRYTFWIAIGFAFNGMYYMVANYIFFAGKTHLLAWVTFFTAIVNIALNYLLITLNGAVGAAQASALALLLSFVLTWFLSSRVYSMPWRLRTGAGI